MRVIVPHAFGQDKLVGPLARYLQQHAGMTVEWLLHDDRAIQDYIAAGIDCAIQVGEVTDPGLVAIPLGQVPRIVVAAPLPVSLVYPYARFYPARLRRFIDLIRAEAGTLW